MEIIEVKGDSGRLLAVIFYRYAKDTPIPQGVNFITKEESPLQVATVSHKKGTVIQPHYHNSVDRHFSKTIETLIVHSGEIRVDLYDVTEVQSYEIGGGDFIILFGGGHGFEILADTEVIEVRTGPYLGRDRDKTFILPQNYTHLEND